MHKWIYFVLGLSLILSAVCQSSENKQYAIINTTAANLREKPSHKSELLDQEIMGYSVKLLNKKDNWHLVETEYGYKGWTTESSFYAVDCNELEAWKKCPKVRVKAVLATVYSQPKEKSVPVASVGMNTLLKNMEVKFGSWIKTALPDGRIGYIKKKDCVDYVKIKLSRQQLAQSIVDTAKMMMGVGYLWGGKSSFANDCSGFTSTVFRANGISIPRDSYMQALEGREVAADADFSNVQPGDLLFFGSDKISHVAISLGGKEYIHQSGDVHISSLDPNSPNYNEQNHRKLKTIRRFF